jgi:hypothetical protein
VTFTWTLPSDGGSPITSYRIWIREEDETAFTQELTDCNGSIATIIDELSCTVRITQLLVAPFHLPWGSSIHAKVDTQNIYGISDTSPVGNGAVILTIPDTPINFI